MRLLENNKIFDFIFKKAFKDYSLTKISSDALENTLKTFDKKEIGVYIHIPFCTGFCKYCTYTKFKWDEDKARKYTDSLKKELLNYSNLLKGSTIVDLYVGGGTPSLIEADVYSDILNILNDNFEFRAELSIEANPEDMSERKIDKLLNAGVKRISLGVQSLNPKYIKLLGRRYSLDTAKRAIANTLKANFELVNLDLLYSLPGQTIPELTEDLMEILSYGPHQITTYPLLADPSTKIFHEMQSGKIPKKTDGEKNREMFYTITDTLTKAGYIQDKAYIFSKGEKENYESTNIEMEGDYFGIGCGAYSCMGGLEYSNTHFLDEYIETVNSNSFTLPITLGKKLTQKEKMWKWFISRLCTFYVNEKDFKKAFDEELKKHFGMIYKTTNLLGITKNNGNGFEVTRKGKYIVNLAIWSFVQDVVCGMINTKCQTSPIIDGSEST